MYCNGYCIARGLQEGLCRNTVHCIVTEARHGLYCNTVTVPTTQDAGRAWGVGLGVRRRGRAAGAGVGTGARGRARGALTGRRWACRGARSAGRAAGRGAGRRWAQAAGAGRARPGRWVRCLCAQAGPVGCSCTRLGFQPGFSTRYFFPESPNEHCSL